MKKFSEVQLQILERLHHCHFLTVAQMIDLGIAKTKHTMSRNLTELTQRHQKRRLPLVDFIDFGTFPTIGRIPRLYYLTKAGATLLAEAYQKDLSDIPYPKGWKMFQRDYFHRVQTIDLHISARKFTENIPDMTLDFFQPYFEHTGANHTKDPTRPKRQALTATVLQDGTKFVPDSVFQMTDPTEKQWLFTGEIYRGHTTKRTFEQLKKHLFALQEGAISAKYNYPRAVRVLMVCEEKNAMKALQKRVQESPLFAAAQPYFLFAHLDDVKESFVECWENFSGKKVNPFSV